VGLIDFTTAFTGGPSFYTGSATSDLVPSVFPVAINGRPYLIDSRSGKFSRQLDQRVRDSQDTSTAPGESAINPQGLWRRGQNSWHLGAGQFYADDAAAQDYRFYKSKGISPWTKGQLSLLNGTKRALESANTNLFLVAVRSSGGTNYLYVADGNTLKYTTDPFASSPTWTSVTTGAPAGVAITALGTNGVNVYIGYTSNDIYYTTPGSASVSFFYPTGGSGTGKTYVGFDYAKGWGIASVNNALYVIGIQSGSHVVHYTHPDTTFRWVGAAGGPNAAYAAGHAGVKSIIYKMTLKADATGLDQPIAALELPLGEVVYSIHGYLGFIILGTDKGVRFCTTDSNNNLVAGPLIPTSGAVRDFVADDKYVWFGWSNYDGISSGLGRMDLSTFTSTNAPAFATDLMYGSVASTVTANVASVTEFNEKRVFSISGVGVIVEDTANLVTSGTVEVGNYRWGIPDRKFAPRFDVRMQPLVGSVSVSVSADTGSYDSIGTHSDQGDTEHTFLASEAKLIEAAYKITLTRQTATTGPVLNRWMVRAYAAPARSRLISVPVLIHNKLNVHGSDYFFDVEFERDFLEDLALNPKIITYQERGDVFTVIVEDVQWQAVDAPEMDWLWEGTATVIMRTITE
jgi:hypothetical protein